MSVHQGQRLFVVHYVARWFIPSPMQKSDANQHYGKKHLWGLQGKDEEDSIRPEGKRSGA